MTDVLESPTAYADALREHYVESADDFRRVVVGLQSESRYAEIYADHAHLYTRDQVAAVSTARDGATSNEERDRLTRLWFEAAGGLADADVVRAAQDLMNDRLAWRTTWDGDEVSINGLGALLAAEPDFDRREQVYALTCEADEHFASRDVELADRSQRLRSEVYGMDGEVAIAEARMGVDLRTFADQVQAVADATRDVYATRSDAFVERLAGRAVARPSRAHAAYVRSLHPWDDVYTRERMAEVCERTVSELGFPLGDTPSILPDLEDRPEKDPRACVVPVRVPEEVHLVVRPTGGITDYQAFLHEAGHALHFGLTSPGLPIEHRYLSPDNALTEIYSYVVERITHEPAWHVRHFGLSDPEAEDVVAAIRYVDSSLFRRYVAKLRYELEFWADPTSPALPERYRSLLSDATLMTYPTSQWASDIDPGLYVADYLRAWRTSEQVLAWLRAEHGDEWFCSGAVASFLRSLFEQGTAPTNEDVSRQIGSDPDDFDALVAHLRR